MGGLRPGCLASVQRLAHIMWRASQAEVLRSPFCPEWPFKGFIVGPYVGGGEAEYGGNLGSPLRMTRPWPYGSPSHFSCLMACLDSARGGRIAQPREKRIFHMSRRCSLRHVRI
jgi:hypothetical protein